LKVSIESETGGLVVLGADEWCSLGSTLVGKLGIVFGPPRLFSTDRDVSDLKIKHPPIGQP